MKFQQRYVVLCSTAALSFGVGGAVAEEARAVEEVVVTGKAGTSEITKFESSYSITTMDEQSITEQAPTGITDLLSSVPGFFAEQSGGVAGGNVWTRGIPIAAGYRYSPLLEDGLPVIADGDIPFTNPDVLMRIDDTVQGVEVVRGGPGSIFYSNAAGGAINVISKKGAEEFEGSAKVTTGDYGLYRGDFTASGPLTEDLTYHIGGFYRVDDGVRPPGFTANEGYQYKASLTYTGEGYDITVRHKELDDRNIFYLPIPLRFDGDNVSGVSGLDPNFGTIVSADFRLMEFEDRQGKFSADLQDGIHPQLTTDSLEANAELGDGWFLTERASFVRGTNDMSSIFSIFDPVPAADYLADRLLDAQAVDPSVAALTPRFVSSGENFNIANENGNGFLQRSGWLAIDTDLRNFQNDIQLNKYAGNHDVTLGLYYSNLDFDQTWHWDTFLHETRDAPRAVDLIAVDASGNEIRDIRLTRNGITEAGFLPKDGTTTMESLAFYVNDNWQMTEALRLDFGIRYQENDYQGLTGNVVGCLFNGSSGCFDLDGDPRTFYDIGAYTDGTYQVVDQTRDGITWTLGANWEISQNLALFGRVTESEIMPDMRTAYDNATVAGEFTVPEVSQYELGLKYRADGNWGDFDAFIAGFANEFKPFVFALSDVNFPAGFVELNTETVGVEWELSYQMGDSGFGIDVSGMYQKPEFKSGGLGLPSSIDPDGNQIQRTPEQMWSFKPHFRFSGGDLFQEAKFYSRVSHVGERYQDVANKTLLPEYTSIDVGLIVDITDALQLTAIVTNVDNEIGVQEGNPRTSTLSGQTGASIVQGRPIFGRTVKVSLGMAF